MTQLKALSDYLAIVYASNVLKVTLIDSILGKQTYLQAYLEGLTMIELKNIADAKTIVDYLTMTKIKLVEAILATQA